MFKKNFASCLCISVLLLLFSYPLQAQETPPDESLPTDADSTPPPDAGDSLLTFSTLNFNEQVIELNNLTGNYNLNIPAHWRLTEGAILHLEMQPVVRQNGIVQQQSIFGGLIMVYFNNELIGEALVNSNEKIVLDLPIPTQLLENDGRGAFPLSIVLQTDFECGSPNATSVQILEESYFLLPHEIVDPVIDLRLLPFPIQQNSYLPNIGAFVIPDNALQSDAKALITTSAAFGRLTNRATFTMVRESELTDELRASAHLVFIGELDDFSLRDDLFSAEEIAEMQQAEADDGLIKMAVSPWEQSKVILLVSGTTADGVLKAANALNYGVIRPINEASDLAIVKEVIFEPPVPTETFRSAFTFSDLGHDLRTLNGPQLARQTFSFAIPTERPFTLQEDGSLVLVFNHSDLLDYENSGFNVTLNNRPIGSSRFTKETTNVTSLPIVIPAGLLRAGSNSLAIEANLNPLTGCSSFSGDGTWLNIFPESSVSLPIEFVDTPVVHISPTISSYPKPFSDSNDLDTTTIIVPENSREAWFTAVQLAFDLGKNVNGQILELDLVFANDISEETLNNDHLIIIGKALDQPIIIDELNSKLPGPFIENSNRIQSDRLPVEYRVPDSIPLGYIQMVASPWVADGFVLLIGGDTDEGLQNATDVLLNNSRNLSGDLVVIDQNGIYTTVTPEDIEPASTDSANAEETEETSDPAETAVLETDAEPEQSIEDSEDEVVEEAPEDDNEDESEADEEDAPEENAEDENGRFDLQSLPRLPLIVLVVSILALFGVIVLYGITHFTSRRKRG